MKKVVSLLLFYFLILPATDNAHAFKVSFNLQIGTKGSEKGQLQNPSGIAASKDGIIHVVDSKNHRIQSFSSTGESKSVIGSKGEGDGQFSSPYAIALSPDGKLFVTDSGNHRVQVFDKDGKFLYSFGKKGNSDGEMSYPKGIAVDKQERVYVVDSGNRRIAVFTIDGVSLDAFGEKGEGKGQFYDPAGIAASNDGLLWVTDSGNNRIQVFDAKGTFRMSLGSKGSGKDNLLYPTGVSIDPFGRVAVVDGGNGRIQILNSKGELLGSLGSKGEGRAQFVDPQSVHLDESGNCYIADSGNNRVQLFSMKNGTEERLVEAPLSGRLSLVETLPVRVSDVAVASSGNIYLLDRQEAKVTILDKGYNRVGSFGKSGKDKGMFSDPSSITIGDNGHIFVSDTGNHRIQVFDKDGKYLYEFGGKGSTDGKLYNPGGLALKMGKLWVADTGNCRIQIFSPDGIFLGRFGKKGSASGELSQPMDLGVDSKGYVYVADYGNSLVQVFSAEGKLIGVIGRKGAGKGEFLGPKGVVVDDDDRVFVIESEKGVFGGGNNRIQVFNQKREFLYRFASYGKGRGEINSAESISYSNTDNVNLFLSDTGNGRLYIFALNDVPTPPKGVKLESDENGVKLSWQKSQESFINGYRVYGAREPQSGYGKLADVKAQETVVELKHRKESPDYYYGVTALAKGGLESPTVTLTDKFRIGYDRYLAGKFDDASAKFSDLLNEDPSNNRALYYVGLSYLASGTPDGVEKAKEAFSKLSTANGFEESARLNMGKIALMQGRFSDAESELNRVVEINSESAEGYSLLGRACVEQGFLQKALECLTKAAELDPATPGVFESLGLAYYKSKAYEKAISSYEKGLSVDTNNNLFHKYLGETYLAMRNIKKAREEFKIFLGKSPDDVSARLRLAETALELKDGQEALEHANIVLGKNKDNPEARIVRGKAQLLLGKKEDALLAFKGAVELDAKNEEGRYMTAFVYKELNLTKEGMEALQKLIELNKNHEAGHLLMAEMLAAGNKEKAIEEYRTVQRINPKNPSVYFPLGKLLVEKKDYDGARKELETAIKYEAGNVEAHILLGSALRTLGRNGEAINVFQSILEINKESFIAHQELGKIYMDNGIMDKAIGEFKTAATLAPQSAGVQLFLGRAFLKKLRFDEAIEAFSVAVKIDPQESAKNELNEAYEAKKKFIGAKQNVPVIEIGDATIHKVFASLYKYYNDNPIGEIKISNNSDETFSSIKVSIRIMKYMDFPADKEIKDVKPRGIETVPLHALFNNKILEIVEDTPAQAEVEISYYRAGKEEKNKLTIPFTIYNRNSITWDVPAMTGAFVTPKDEPVKEFARGLVQQYSDNSSFMNKQMSTAMLVFDALGAYGMAYSSDPNNPYEKVSLGGGAIDSMQYPRETLKLKSGDCDDLSTLIAALLENLGIETAYIETPGHLHLMFRLDIDPDKVDAISLNPEQYVIIENKVWIPLEATAVGSSFSEAWYKGSEIYYRWQKEKKVEITKVHDAWVKYQPATLPPAAWSPTLPAKEKIDAIMAMEVNLQKTKKILALIKPLQDKLAKTPKDTKARMQLGLIYGENDLFAEAMNEFNEIIAIEPANAEAFTNLGNTWFGAGKLDNALENYKKAETISQKDAEIKVNLAIVYYKKGMVKEAQKKLSEAVEIKPEIKDERSFLYSQLFR